MEEIKLVDRTRITTLTSYEDARAALYSPAIARVDAQDRADYCMGNVLEDTINALHGTDHRDRRRHEAAVFSQAHRWGIERDVLVRAIRSALDRARTHGRTRLNLIEFTRQIAILNAITVVGLDVAMDAVEDQLEVAEMARIFAAGAGVEETTRPQAELLADVKRTLGEYDKRYFRRAYEARVARLAKEPTQPATDVLQVLVALQDKLGLTYRNVLLETSFHMAAASDTTTQATAAVLHYVFESGESPAEMGVDRGRLQLWLHEALRIRSVVPVINRRVVEEVSINGQAFEPGQKLHIDVHAANCDPSVFGEDAAEFNPMRPIDRKVPRFGLAFGGGVHACLGKGLAAGSPIQPGEEPDENHLYGVATVIASELLKAGVVADPDAQPQGDPNTIRWTRWASYPVLLPGAMGVAP